MTDGAVISVQVRRRAGGLPGIATLVNERASGAFDKTAQAFGDAVRQSILLYYDFAPIAHLTAFDAAKRAACGISEDERREADDGFTERVLTLEALADSLRFMTIDAPQVLGRAPDPTALTRLGELRRGLRPLLQALLAFDLTRNERAEALRLAAERVFADTAKAAAAFLEETVLGMAPAAFVDTVRDPDHMAAWAASAPERPAADLLQTFLSASENFGRIDCELLPDLSTADGARFADEIYHRLRDEPGFDVAPVWGSQPRLTGALARRRGERLLCRFRGRFGINAAVLTAARIIDAACSAARLTGTGGCSVLPVIAFPIKERHAGGIAMVQTARGLLTHAWGTRQTADGTKPFHGVTTPTEWQFTPDGPAQQAVQSALRVLGRTEPDPSDARIMQTVRLALFGLDPSLPLQMTVRAAPSDGGKSKFFTDQPRVPAAA